MPPASVIPHSIRARQDDCLMPHIERVWHASFLRTSDVRAD